MKQNKNKNSTKVRVKAEFIPKKLDKLKVSEHIYKTIIEQAADYMNTHYAIDKTKQKQSTLPIKSDKFKIDVKVKNYIIEATVEKDEDISDIWKAHFGKVVLAMFEKHHLYPLIRDAVDVSKDRREFLKANIVKEEVIDNKSISNDKTTTTKIGVAKWGK